MIRRGWWAAGVSAAVLVAGCGSPSAPKATTPTHHVITTTYVAIGSSDAVGNGSTDPLDDAWPQILFRDTLPPATVFYNLATPTSTMAQALGDQLPEAEQLTPSLVTVDLGTTDLFDAVPSATFGAQLHALLTRLLQRGHPTVLVANLAPVTDLPGYQACLAGTPLEHNARRCPDPVPSPATLNTDLAAYNAQIAHDARITHATLVDLFAATTSALAKQGATTLVASDGFNPSDAGQQLIATTFREALPSDLRAEPAKTKVHRAGST